MHKTFGYGAASLAAIALLVVTARQATTQVGGSMPAFVKLQATTPGTAQTGNSNLTGTAIAAQFQGGGAGLTGVNAELLDGLNSTAFLQSIPIPLTLMGSDATHIIRGENSSAFSGASAVFGMASAASSLAIGGRFETLSTNGRGVHAEATSASGGSYGVFARNASASGTGVFGQATNANGFAYGLHGESRGEEGTGVYGVATSTGWGPTYGGYFVSNSINGSGVYAEGNGDSGAAIAAYATSNIGLTSGLYAVNFSPDGRGVTGLAHANTGSTFGGYFASGSTSGLGVFGYASANTGMNYGGHFASESPNGRGVSGHARADSGANYGVFGETDSTTGRGVYGVATAASGSNFGVRGYTASGTGYAVYANGDLGASGTKSFRIDHPFDPENKYLLHYSTESPVPQNFYVGNVVTDADGYTWVELPDYFAEINTNFKYQLTVISGGQAFVQAMVSKEVSGTRFQVRTSAPSVKVSWRVDADRNDLYVRNRKPKAVVEKEGEERGKYQHPELYGKPASMGMDFDAKRPVVGENRVGRP